MCKTYLRRTQGKAKKQQEGISLNHVRAIFLASVYKKLRKDPGRARQNSQAAAGTNVTKPGSQDCVCGYERNIRRGSMNTKV